MLRRNTYEVWTENHQHVTRKLVVGEGWVQKRLYDIAWSDERSVEYATKKKARRSADCTIVPLPVLAGGQKPDPRKAGEIRGTPG